MIMLKLLIFVTLNAGFCYCIDVPIQVNLLKPAAFVDAKFLSVTIDSSTIKHALQDVDLTSKKLISLANGFTSDGAKPEVFLRIGGSDANHVKFDPNEMYILNVTELKSICKFVDTLGWKLIFDLNVLLRKEDGSWDSSNAVEFIDYLESDNFSLNYELGNEPDLFPIYENITIPPKQLAKDFSTLHDILNSTTAGKSMLIGPDIGPYLTRYNYFGNVLSNMTQGVLDAVSFHHYYSSSDNVTSINFTDVEYLDRFLTHGLEALSVIKLSFSTFPHPPVWIGETSSTYGGGSPALGESFAAGFLWLDKLGLAAQMNISVVIRQALKGGYCSLINKNYVPTPDYWSSMLYKQLMGRIVLDVTGYLQYGRQVRVYSHCINENGGRGYQPSSVVLMVLNLDHIKEADIRFSMVGWNDLIADLYLFQPAYGKLSDGYVTLNGRLLKMVNDTTFPLITPVRVQQPYIIPPLSYGFLVILNATATACKH